MDGGAGEVVRGVTRENGKKDFQAAFGGFAADGALVARRYIANQQAC